MPLTDEELIHLINQASDFPRLSAEATELARMGADLSAPVKDVADSISADPELVTRLLEVVNSGLYGIQDEVARVDQAIQLLGYKKVCNLAVGLSLMTQFPKEKGGVFDYHQFWEKSICYGVAAATITSKLPSDLPVDTFSIGLMLDVGSLFLVRYRPLEYGAALGVARGKKEPMVLAEQEAIGVDHAKIGALLSRKWKLPKVVGDVILSHHFVETSKTPAAGIRTILQVMNLASLFPAIILDDDDDQREKLDARAKEFFNFSPKAVDVILAAMKEPLTKVGEAFSVQMHSKARAAAEEAARPSTEPITCTKCRSENPPGAKFCSSCGSPLSQEPVARIESNRILVAEDSTASRRALCFFIKKLGYVPVEATNGFEAYDLARQHPPGMILLDIMMPVMNGLEALKKIRNHKALSQVPVLMLTSLTDNDTVIEAIQAGANDYVVKPYTAEIISERVEKFMPKPRKKPSEKY